MKLRYLFYILAFLQLVLLFLLFYSAAQSQDTLFYIGEGVVILVLVFLIYFYYKVLKPLDAIGNGMDLLNEQDFSSRLKPVGQQESDRIVQVFPEGMQQQIRMQLSMTLVAVITQQLVPKKNGGRVLAAELMVVNDAIRNLIRAGNTPQIANAVATSASIGGQTMDQALVRLVRSGIISRENALYYAKDQGYVKKNAI